MNRLDSPPSQRPAGAQAGPKTYAIILTTLALGMLLGAVLTGFVARQTSSPGVPEMMIGHDSIESAFLDLIEPTEAQREAIWPILRDAQQGVIGNMVMMRCRMRTHVDSIVVQLDAHLTEEQMKRVTYAMQEQPDEEFVRRMPAEVMEQIQRVEALRQGQARDCTYRVPRIPLLRPSGL